MNEHLPGLAWDIYECNNNILHIVDVIGWNAYHSEDLETEDCIIAQLVGEYLEKNNGVDK